MVYGHSYKRRRRSRYPSCPDDEIAKKIEILYRKFAFWDKIGDQYESQNDDPVLKIDWYERHLMDIGVKEVTIEYYRAKMLKIKRWSESDELEYQAISDKKLSHKLFRNNSNSNFSLKIKND
jgi:hypothetical protein